MVKLDPVILLSLPFAVTFQSKSKFGDVQGVFYRELEEEAEQVYINCCMSDVLTNIQIHKPKS